ALLVPARPGEHTAAPPRSGSTGCCPPVHGLFSPRWATGGGRNGPHGGEEPFGELGAGLLPRLVVHFLPGGGHRQRGDEPVGPGPLVAGQHRVLPAVLFALGRGERVVGGDRVGHHELAPMLVRYAHHQGVGDLGVLVEHFFHLHRVHVLPTGDDHVVLAAHDGDVLLAVPRGEVADVEPAVVELRRFLVRRIDVGVAALGGPHDHFADLVAVLGHGLIRSGQPVVEDLHHRDVVVGARSTGTTGVFGQIGRA